MKRGKLVILLIEDDENDVILFQAASEHGLAGHTVHPVQRAQEAISYLRGEGQYSNRQTFPVPNVILCDVKMPGMDGFQFLEWLRSHPECSVIPTILFTSSAQEDDIIKAYRLGATSFITKPHKIQDLIDLLRALYEYWSRCECPPMQVTC